MHRLSKAHDELSIFILNRLFKESLLFRSQTVKTMSAKPTTFETDFTLLLTTMQVIVIGFILNIPR